MKINYDRLPDHMRQTAKDYIENGVHPGDFLEAVLSNDLKKSFGRADHTNTLHMKAWVLWLYNDVPGHCQGSKEAFELWMKSGGLHGLEKGEKGYEN